VVQGPGGQARHAAVTLLVTGPLVGLLWMATAAASHLGIRFGPPWHWTGLSPVLHLVALAIAVTACAALAGIATTGRLTRWLPPRPRRAPTAAAVAGFGAIGADGLGLALLAAQLAPRGGSPRSWPPRRQWPASPGCCWPAALPGAAWRCVRAWASR